MSTETAEVTETFLAAVCSGDIDTVTALLDTTPTLMQTRGPDGVSAVLTARYSGQRTVADLLLARGVVKDIFDATALGDTKRIASLIDADPTLASAWSLDGFQAIHLAALFGQPASLSLLLELGAPPDIESKHPLGAHPLHLACAGPNPEKAQEMTRMLIRAGVNVNARQRGVTNGFTSLMSVAKTGDPILTRILLDAGADRNLKSGEKTALDYARESGNAETIALLAI